MDTQVECQFEFSLELREEPGTENVPRHRELVTKDLGDLVEETFTSGVLGEKLPSNPAELSIRIKPKWLDEPIVSHLEVELVAGTNGHRAVYSQLFAAGRWTRRSMLRALQMREEGTLAQERVLHAMLLATRNDGQRVSLPPLQPPVTVEQSLEEFGVRRLAVGSLEPDRPVLVNDRMVEEIVELTMAAGVQETGGALLGKIVRLPEPLPETDTRIVTILSASVIDRRHVGAPSQLTFSPEALAEADQLSQMRGFGELVLTVLHTHGWGRGCDNCNQNQDCALPECTLVSLQDYQLLESLFPSKATLMPIAGRKLGAQGRRPVLEIHAWRGGQMRPIRWQRYHD